MNEIKSITIISQTGVKQYSVDDNIKSIDDRTSAFGFPVYEIYDYYNKLVARIENCPVEIIFK